MLEYQDCDSGFDIPVDSPLFEFLTHLAALTGIIFFAFTIFVGPINILGNIFVMFIMTRKELRSSHNFVFFLMALDQTIVIGSLTITSFRTMLLLDCTPSYFSLFWAVFDLTTQQLVPICKAHATWLAVIVALMRLMSIRSKGASELQFNLVVLLCGGALVFVVVANTPNFFSDIIIWIRFKDLCDSDEFGDIEVPFVWDSPVIYMNDCLVLRLTSLLSGVLHSGLPCLLLIILTVILLRLLRKVRKERELMLLHTNAKDYQDSDRTTTLLILIMISTMISEIPQAILSILEGFLSSKIRDQLTSKIALLVASLMLLTSASNLFIYLFMSKKFREVSKSYVCFPCRKFRKIAASGHSSTS